LNLNHLSIFQAVAQAGSVSAGARKLRVSQSAVSKQLAEFESTLGLSLFDRLPRGVRLTDAGRLLQTHADRLIATEKEAEAAIRDLKMGVRGRLQIGASRTVGAYLMPPLLARFRREFADVEIALHVENTATIESRLIAGEIDIGFAEGIIGSDLLEYQVFDRDELILIVAPDHALAGAKQVSPSQLAQHDILMHETGSGTRSVTEKALSEKGITLRPCMTLASTEAIKRTAVTGIGAAILSVTAVRSELESGSLVQVPIKGLRIHRPLYRILRKGIWSSPALQAFINLISPVPA